MGAGVIAMPRRLITWSDRQVETLYPGCFAFVMATGIVSNALLAESFHRLSDLLFTVTALAYLLLAGLLILRAMRFPRALRADLINPLCVFSFFTLVAGSDVLGAGLYLRGFAAAALYVWLFAVLVWVPVFYFSFAVWIFRSAGSGAAVVQGGWLLAIVGTESITVLGAAIAARAGRFDATILVFSHILWGLGLVLYAIYVTLFVYRIVFFPVEPEDLSPTLWVVMGAAAISTNAGSALIATGGKLPYLDAMRPFLESTTLIVWAWATLWIPFLILMGIWKHGRRQMPLTYTPLLWSIVFPLGMYSIATLRFAAISGFEFLRVIAGAMLWIALAAWLATLAALALASWRKSDRADAAARLC